MPRHLRLAGTAWAFAALITACHKQPMASPEDLVNGFFAAVASNDCEGAAARLGGLAKSRFESEPCDDALEALRRKRFERVLSSQVDGRDPELHLVRVRFARERSVVVIGVRKTRQGPRIVTF